MKIKPFNFLCIALVCCGLLQCKQTDQKPEVVTTSGTITPVPLPTNIVPGFNFPEDSTVILGWTKDKNFPNQYDSVNIYKHAWGIWAGLTAATEQTYAGDSLLVYETWLGLSEVQQLVIDGKSGCEGVSVNRSGRAPLSRPKQFEHAARFSDSKAAFTEDNVNFWVTVSYSPDAACFATENKIFKQSVINKYYKAGGMASIQPFPAKSLTLKPAYLIYEDTNELFKVPVWKTAPVPPDSNFFSAAEWFVFVDKNNAQPAGKVAVPATGSETDPAKIAAATVNLSDFISLKVDAQMASFMNKQDSIQGLNGGGRAQAGQIALLVAMHVTTKEISNWTWQSYYWTPDPSHPGSPSSDLAASLRPSEITGAAAHYACVAAYVMLTPGNAANNDPKAGAMFGYNPYLEGGFGPGVFPFVNRFNKDFKYGVQSNCMSCHGLAIPPSTGLYTTDQNIDLKKDPYFKDQVSLDFAWSIQTALINDTIPYWQK